MEEIRAIMMLEILGKPEEHVKKTLEEYVNKLSEEKNVKLIEKKIAEPKKVENEEIFSSFAEVEIETNLETLMLLIFGYMPSHIEIIEPEEFKMKNHDLNLFMNELTRKLHQYEEIVRALLIERQTLAEQIKSGKVKIIKDKETKKTKGKKKN